MPVSPDKLEVLGLASLENAPDPETGQQWLMEDFNSSDWSNPAQASQILDDYGTRVRQKFSANSADATSGLEQYVPLALNQLPDPPIEDPEERALVKIDQWEQANLEALKTSTDAQQIVRRSILNKFVADSALTFRRRVNNPGVVTDTAARFATGVISPITGLFGAPEPEFLKEHTSPQNDDDFLSELVTGGGTVVTAIGAGLAATPALLAYLGAGAVGSVKNTVQEVKEQTGSTQQAVAAGAIDAAGQGAGFALGGAAAGRVASRILKAGSAGLTTSTAELAAGGTVEAAKRVFKETAKTVVLQGSANVAMGVGALGARRVGLDDENIDVFEGAGRNFAVGGILGGVAEAGVGGYSALNRRLNNARARRRAATAPEIAAEVSPETTAAVEAVPDPAAEADAALREIAKDLPEIDLDGIAHQREAQEVYKAPATEEQIAQAENASRFFKTSANDQYELLPDGSVGRRTGPSGELAPGDTMRFVDPETAAKLVTLKNIKTDDGHTPKIYTDAANGELFVYGQNITDDLDVSDVPTGSRFIKVQSQREAAVGKVPVSANIPAVSDGKKVFSSNIGNTITDIVTRPEIVTPREPGELEPNSRIRMVSERLTKNRNLPRPIQEAFAQLNDRGELESTLRYIPQSMNELQSLGGRWISERGGMETALIDLLEGGNNVTNEAQAGGFQLTAALGKAVSEAQRSNDFIAEVKLVDLAAALKVKLGEIGTYRGQGVNQLKEAQRLDPENQFAFELGQVTKTATDAVLAREGINLADAERQMTRVRELKEAIKAAKDDVALRTKLENERAALEEKINVRTEAVKSLVGKKFTPKQQEEYRNLLRLRAELPEGALRAKQDRKIDAIEYKLQTPWYWRLTKGLQDFYVSNILAEVGTLMAAGGGTVFNVAAAPFEATVGTLARGGSVRDIPGNLVEFTRQITRGAPRSVRLSIDALVNGNRNRFGADDFFASGPPLLRYVGLSGRALAAIDAWGASLASEPMTAIRILETNPEIRNLTGEARRTAIDDVMYGNAEVRRNAEAEADRQMVIAERFGEKMTKRDREIIVDDIIDRQRPQNIREEMEFYGDQIAMRAETKGGPKVLENMLNAATRFPGMEKFILFNRTMANMLEQGVNYSPLGFVRPGLLALTSRRSGAHITPFERSLIYTRAALGTTAAAGVYAAWQAGAFDINGAGPSNPDERRAWEAAGNKPFSFQRGDSIIQYGWWPMAPTFAAIGGYADYLKYSKDKDAIKENEAINYIMVSGLQGMIASPLMSNVAELAQIGISAARGGDTWGALQRLGARVGVEAVKNSVLPFNRALRNVTGIFQDPLDSRQALAARVLSGIPWAGADGLPRINMFGEPINDGKDWTERWNSISRFYIQQTQDPRFRFLTEKGYYVRQVPFKVTIPDEGFRAAKRSREARLGMKYTDVFTQRENYEMQKIAGPMLSDLVLEFRSKYSNGPWSEDVQKKLNDRVNKVYSKAKRQVVGLELEEEE